MTLFIAAAAALIELRDLHGDMPQCPGPDHCPTAKAIRDLELAMAEAQLSEEGREEFQAVAPFPVEDATPIGTEP